MKKHRFYFRDKAKKSLHNYIILKNIKIFKKNYKIKNTLRQKIMIKTYNLNKNFNIYKLKKYCYFTGRLRFLIKNYKMSRMTFREFSSKGLITGMYKK